MASQGNGTSKLVQWILGILITFVLLFCGSLTGYVVSQSEKLSCTDKIAAVADAKVTNLEKAIQEIHQDIKDIRKKLFNENYDGNYMSSKSNLEHEQNK